MKYQNQKSTILAGKSKTILSCDNVINNLIGSCYKSSQKNYPESALIYHLPLGTIADCMMFSCLLVTAPVVQINKITY